MIYKKGASCLFNSARLRTYLELARAIVTQKAFCLIMLSFVLHHSAFGQEEATGFKASGEITSRVLTPNQDYRIKQFQFEIAVIGDKWRITLGQPATTEIIWDGTNQHVMKLPTGSTNVELSAFVHPYEVPQGGGLLRSLWLGFLVQKSKDGERFPNLLTFQYPPPKTNTILRLKHSAAGQLLSADLVYPYENKEYLTQRLTVQQSSTEGGFWKPLEYTVDIFARLGVEFTPGQPSPPTPGVEYSKVLEKYEVIVNSQRKAVPQDIIGTDLTGFKIKVLDQRVGGIDFPLTYLATNKVPTENEIRSNPIFSTKILSLERAQKEFIPKQAHMSTTRRSFLLLILIAISGGTLLILWRNLRRN